jgi:O-6-methylguanine DNA methyltransferase
MRPWLHTFESPLGPIQAAANDRGELVYLGFQNHEPRQRLMQSLEAAAAGFARDPDRLTPLRHQLDAYFQGHRSVFDLPLDLRGTSFRKRVWTELQRIPFGSAISYGELAARLGNANLTRAVGAANGANPISILVPCHRVIGADGSLTGYAGGLGIKEALLRLEGFIS